MSPLSDDMHPGSCSAGFGENVKLTKLHRGTVLKEDLPTDTDQLRKARFFDRAFFYGIYEKVFVAIVVVLCSLS